MTLLRRRSRARAAPRSAPSSPDPVLDAIREETAGPPLRRQYDDLEPVLGELPGYLDASDCDHLDGFDTMVTFADEIHAYIDPADAGLETILAEQPGIDAVFAEDREVLFLRTRLSLDDVRAAVIGAVAEGNRAPRPRVPEPGVVTDDDASRLSDAAEPPLLAAGFARRSEEPGRERYFIRAGGDGFLQSATVMRGLGELTDGTRLHRYICITVGVHVPGAARPSQVPHGGLEHFFPIHCTLTKADHLAPTPEAVTRHMVERALPWLEDTRDQGALAAWAAADPERIWLPAERPRYARLFAEWGELEAARILLRHIDRKWKRLRKDPDTVAARAILDARG